MFKGLKALWKFVVKDFVSDWKFIFGVFNGKIKPRKIDWRRELKSIRWVEMIKQYWLWYFIIAMAFGCGYLYSAWALQDACNSFILEHYFNDSLVSSYSVPFNFSVNMS